MMHSNNVNVLLVIAAILCALGGLIAWVIILIDAFNDAWWKAVAFFLCGFYAFFYSIFEFDHDRKWEIVILAWAGFALSGGLLRLTT